MPVTQRKGAGGKSKSSGSPSKTTNRVALLNKNAGGSTKVSDTRPPPAKKKKK